jgi:serine/threonine protein kinase
MITKGETPDSPPSMSIGLGDLAKKCMAYDPEDRLSMAHVMAYFKHAWHSFLPEHPSTIVKAKKSCGSLIYRGQLARSNAL